MGGDAVPRPAEEPFGVSQARRSLVSLTRRLGPWFMGLCCGNVWIGWMNQTHAVASSALWQTVCSATMLATLAAAIFYGARSKGLARPAYSADWPVAVLMAASTLPATSVLGLPEQVALAATVASQVGMAWLYVRWGVFLARLGLRETIACIFCAHVAGCAVKLALDYVPAAVAAGPVALLPLASVALLRRATWALGDGRASGPGAAALTEPQPQRKVWVSAGEAGWGPFWKVAGFLFVYRILFQLAGALPNAREASRSLSAICCLVEIGVSVTIIYMLYVRSGSFTFHQVWSIFLVLLAVAIVLRVPGTADDLSVSTLSAAGSLLVMFSWLVFADMAHHSDLHPFVLFGVARAAYELPRLIVCPLQLAGFAPDRALAPSLLLFALFMFAIYFFDRRDPALALVFSDFDKPVPLTERARLADVCRDVAQRYGLSPREADVLRLLCEGRSRAYIAESLYLSENTVRNHTQRVYVKLGVHNKDELRRLAGV